MTSAWARSAPGRDRDAEYRGDGVNGSTGNTRAVVVQTV